MLLKNICYIAREIKVIRDHNLLTAIRNSLWNHVYSFFFYIIALFFFLKANACSNNIKICMYYTAERDSLYLAFQRYDTRFIKQSVPIKCFEFTLFSHSRKIFTSIRNSSVWGNASSPENHRERN